MKIFLCSTAYDLFDFRAFVVDLLASRGHEVLYHESPTFPSRVGLHSHDQCIEAVKEADILLCLVDKRYGGKFSGEIDLFANQEFKVKGSNRIGERKDFPVTVLKNDLSITWCELLTAYKNNIHVMTFARQRVLNEKDTRRKNQELKSFRPAFVDNNLVFDMLDWITKQESNNWISSFDSVVDFGRKLETWIIELEKAIPRRGADAGEQNPGQQYCILVEGEIDRIVINHILSVISPNKGFLIIPCNGKYQILNNSKVLINDLGKKFKEVLVIVDTDAYTDDAKEDFIQRTNNLIRDSGPAYARVFYAHPIIEAWIASGIVKLNHQNMKMVYGSKNDIYRRLMGSPCKRMNSANINDCMRRFNLEEAIKNSLELKEFVEYIKNLD